MSTNLIAKYSLQHEKSSEENGKNYYRYSHFKTASSKALAPCQSAEEFAKACDEIRTAYEDAKKRYGEVSLTITLTGTLNDQPCNEKFTEVDSLRQFLTSKELIKPESELAIKAAA